MTALSDFVALSLLPPLCWLHVAERLRAGDTAERHARTAARTSTGRDDPDNVGDARRRRAAAALAPRRGSAASSPIPWSDAAYPPALTTIVDPPPVLWVRGGVASR